MGAGKRSTKAMKNGEILGKEGCYCVTKGVAKELKNTMV